MGNCQAVNAAVLVLQHPGGKIDREEEDVITKGDDKKQRRRDVRFTRVHLLRPTESLVLGHAYQLITSQEVMNVIKEKKYAKTKKHHTEKKQGKQIRVSSKSTSSLKYKTWKPSLQSISEATS